MSDIVTDLIIERDSHSKGFYADSNLVDTLNEAIKEISQLQAEVEGLRGIISKLGEDCPDCDNSGSIPHYRENGDCEALQCEFCYTVKNSKFNIEALLNEHQPQ